MWNEFVHERERPEVRELYPDGIHGAVAAAVGRHHPGSTIRTATLHESEHGLSEDVLARTDTLFWWSHMRIDDVDDAVAARVVRNVLAGMGLVVLHSAHLSKPFRMLMGTSCNLRWREADDRELVWTVAPLHPIAAGVPSPLAIDRQEMYSEVFDVPAPDELVFISSFTGGEVFRSGCCFRRGGGRIFYFGPGHETYPVYHHPDVQRVLANAAWWAAGTRERTAVAEDTVYSPAGWFER